MKNKGEGEQSNLVVEGKGEVQGFCGLNLDNQPQQWWVEARNRSAIDQGGNYGRRRGFKREDEGNSNLDVFPFCALGKRPWLVLMLPCKAPQHLPPPLPYLGPLRPHFLYSPLPHSAAATPTSSVLVLKYTRRL